MTTKYKQAYYSLGEERVQEVEKKVSGTGALCPYEESDQYWTIRQDQKWTTLPGIHRFNRRTQKSKYICTVPFILITLEPGTNFNPSVIWRHELAKDEKEEQELALAASGKKGEVVKVEKLKGKDKIRADIEATNSAKKLNLEVTRIRNSKNNLLNMIRDIKIPEARAILVVEILKNAYENIYKKTGDKKLLFETLWAIEGSGVEIKNFKAPDPVDIKKTILVKDYSLVYDDFSKVEKLLKSSRKVMNQETDLIRLQLMEMSDSLPPLSKFTFGFKLDLWQRRVLRWIDSGKSVVICAPTSSGKTVLSSYVALIFKSEFAKDASNRKDGAIVGAGSGAGGADGHGKAGSGGGGGALRAAAGGEDDEEEFDGEDEEEEQDEWELENHDNAFADLADEEDENVYGQSNNGSGASAAANDIAAEGDLAASFIRRLANADKRKRQIFNDQKISFSDGMQRVLFVVPTEPLVWQVASYFTKLLREEGEQNTKIAIVTDQMIYYPPDKFDVMPQIVVGTPMSLETALTKCRGLTGYRQTNRIAQGDILPGGFDHFDWVIYDEVHSLDGPEGSALQRLIRAMNCKFLALSATVGNAEELRGWMERVKGDQLLGVESITVGQSAPAPTSTTAATEVTAATAAPSAAAVSTAAAAAAAVSSVKIVKTLSGEMVTIDGVTAETTVLQLKQKLYTVWPSIDPEPIVKHSRYPVQLVYKGVDLVEDKKPISTYGVFSSSPEQAEQVRQPVIYLNLLVHLVVHQGRFINLQRYIWDGGKSELMTISPLAAIESVDALKNGVLNKSSLSFTSKDSYRMWEELARIYPYSAVEHLDPHNFFGERERVVLQRTKDYEDLLKSSLRLLASDYPVETCELLHSFQIQDASKEFDLCEMILDLKARDMLPCLPFHLNTFEAIKLFQQLLAGIEYKQKKEFPTYYLDLKAEKELLKKETEKSTKSTGKNEKELEEQMKAGEIDMNQNFSVDPYAPHPNYIFSMGTPITELELTLLVDEMEKYDGFEKRDKEAMRLQKGKNQAILKHALIRGLRRGIGLFTNEVSFPAYRRAVQKLASRGKLAVVISDDSLAFGVNMPFRTCIFCGEMFEKLDELMAQQMSGRAGRRGLDTQGNLVYAGLRVSRIRRLMIGTVSNITGASSSSSSAGGAGQVGNNSIDTPHSPRYASLFLQPLLSPRHVGWNRGDVIGGRSLYEYIHKLPMPAESYTLGVSRRIMTDLGFIKAEVRVIGENGDDDAAGGAAAAVAHKVVRYVPNDLKQCNYGLLAAIWQLRDFVDESVSIGLMLPDIIEEFDPLLTGFSFNDRFTNLEKLEPLVFNFLSLLVLLIDRSAYDRSKADTVSLYDVPYFSQPARKEYVQEWEERYNRMQKESIPDQWSCLRSAVPPGTELDGTFFYCLIDRNFVHTLHDETKQVMKEKMWKTGNVLRVLSNCTWPEGGTFQRFSFFILRTCFNKIRYLNSELIRKKIDFVDVSSSEREKRNETKAVERPPESMPWSDNNNAEQALIAPPAWADAMMRLVARCRQLAVSGKLLDPKSMDGKEQLQKMVEAFRSAGLRVGDVALLQIVCSGAAPPATTTSLSPEEASAIAMKSIMNAKTASHIKDVAQAVARSSHASPSPPSLQQQGSAEMVKHQRIIGVLSWFVLRAEPSVASKFPMYLKTLFDEDLISEEAVRAWHGGSVDAALSHLPVGDADADAGMKAAVTGAEIEKLRVSSKILIDYLDQPDEEDEEDDDEEEEEEG